MSATLENSAVATGLEKVSFHSRNRSPAQVGCMNKCSGLVPWEDPEGSGGEGGGMGDQDGEYM